MKSFVNQDDGQTIILRLDAGDDLLSSVQSAITTHEIDDGYVVSGIGTLDKCVLHMVTTTGYPAVEHFARWEDTPLELASVSGLIAGGVPHLHAVISDKDKAVAGHVELGCRILYLGELVIEKKKGPRLERVKNEKNINVLRERK
ncbi:MAG: PPC domain-containing DNA-binding protein [Treponemataceae bacterium]